MKNTGKLYYIKSLFSSNTSSQHNTFNKIEKDSLPNRKMGKGAEQVFHKRTLKDQQAYIGLILLIISEMKLKPH